MKTSLNARIATRAYYLWIAAGRPEGHDIAHWMAAEAHELKLISRREADAKRRQAAKQADALLAEVAATAPKAPRTKNPRPEVRKAPVAGLASAARQPLTV